MKASEPLTAMDLLELQQLAAEYWARADGDMSLDLANLFTEDAELVLGSLRLAGRDAIERFFRERDATQLAQQRATRHIACNHRTTLIDADRALVRSTVLVYVGNGPLPMQSGAPSGIADFEDICVRAAARPWLFERRSGQTVFVGPGAASFAR